MKYEQFDEIAIHIFAENRVERLPEHEIQKHFQREVEELKGRHDPEGYVEIVYKLLEQAASKPKKIDGLGPKPNSPFQAVQSA